MRNLKRALSLALAAIMVMSLMVVGVSAASYDEFSDKDKIVNKEAVSMLVELGVINGKDDGSYDPQGIVTRAEMAKMICVILNGGKDPQLGEAVKNSYTDTVGHWAAPYIEYCTTLGIVSGRGNGTFDPNGTVSVAEAGKMLLVALGYNAGVEGYTGANWQINVDAQANPMGLYNDLGTLNTNVALTRDNAAQMCYNALDKNMVTYDYVITGTADNSISTKPQINNKDKGTLLEERFNAVKVEGVVIANEYANLESNSKNGAALDEGKTKIAITNGGADKDQTVYTGKVTFTTSTGSDYLGRAVTLYVKKNSNASKAEVLGHAILNDSNKVVIDRTGDSIASVADDNDLDFTSATMIAYNYGNMEKLSAATAGDKAKTGVKAGVEKILIDTDNDGNIEYVLVNTVSFGKVTGYTTSGDGSITVKLDGSNALTTDKKKNVVGFDDVAKNDYVLGAWIGGKLYVEKAETITGDATAYKNDKDGLTTKLTVDGTDYDTSFVPGYTNGNDNLLAATAYGSKDNMNVSATFYLDKGGYIVAVGDVDENAYNYAYVAKLDSSSAVNRQAKVVLSDGSVKTYPLSDKSSKNVTAGGVYAYAITSDKEIKLTNAKINNTGFVTGTDAKFSKNKTAVTGTGLGSTYYATANTVFFYVDGSDPTDTSKVNVYTGYTNAPSLKDNTNISVKVAAPESSTKAMAVVFTGTDLTTTNMSDFLFVKSLGMTDGDYQSVDAVIAGSSDVQTVKVNVGDSSAYAKNGVYLYTKDSKGNYVLESGNLTKPTDGNHAGLYANDPAMSAYHVSSTTVQMDQGATEYKVTKDTILADISNDTFYSATGVTPDKDDKIASMLVNGDDEVLFVLINNDKTSTAPTGDVKITYYPNEYKGYTVAVNGVAVSDPTANNDGSVSFHAKEGNTVTVNGFITGDESKTYTVAPGVTGKISRGGVLTFLVPANAVTLNSPASILASVTTETYQITAGSGVAAYLGATYNQTKGILSVTVDVNTLSANAGALAPITYSVIDDKGGVARGTENGVIQENGTCVLAIPFIPNPGASKLTVQTLTVPAATALLWTVSTEGSTMTATPITGTLANTTSQKVIFKMAAPVNAAKVSVTYTINGSQVTVSTKGTITNTEDGTGLNANEYAIKDGVLYVRGADVDGSSVKNATIDVTNVTVTTKSVDVSYIGTPLDTSKESTTSMEAGNAGAISFYVTMPEYADTMTVAYRINGGERTVATTTHGEPGKVTTTNITPSANVEIDVLSVDVASVKFSVDAGGAVYGTDLSNAVKGSGTSATGLAVTVGTEVKADVSVANSGSHGSVKVQISFKVLNGTVQGAVATSDGTYTAQAAGNVAGATETVTLGTIVPEGGSPVTILITDVTLVS